MQTDIVISGFGGQGVLFAGQILAYAAMDAGRSVTWMPSYGPEMRGGTANCTVIISDEEIGSPLIARPQAAIVLNLPSLDKYEPLVRPGGVLVVNQSLVNRAAARDDLTVVMIPANEMAETLGEKRLLNMIAIGALLAHLPVLRVEDIEMALANHLPERNRRFLPANREALRARMAFGLNHQETIVPRGG